ncbi:MAG: site-specific integrase [Halanaerobiales bacterium]|nr:site-specific integrase [Halanaerobiales bacterium]
MNILLNQMKVDLELRGYSTKTIKAYVRYVKKFATYFNQSLLDLKTQNIKAFLYYLASKKQVSSSYINGAYSALKFFYQKTMRTSWDIIDLPRSKKLKTLPIILSMSEVQNILDTILNIKHKAIFMTIYGAGLRISEIVNLTVEDIDSNNMQIRVQQGKGKKDRYTLLSQTNLDLLRDYWKIYRPVKWLFPGRNPNNPFSTRSVQRIFKETCEKAGVKKKATVHCEVPSLEYNNYSIVPWLFSPFNQFLYKSLLIVRFVYLKRYIPIVIIYKNFFIIYIT